MLQCLKTASGHAWGLGRRDVRPLPVQVERWPKAG